MSDEISPVLEIAKKSIMEIIFNDHSWTPDINLEKYQDMREEQGVFTTIYSDSIERNLRGCIGIPYPQYPLAEAIAISARNTATKDPRFPPLNREEFENVVIEVEILDEIEKIEFSDKEELAKKINIGTHGLIVKYKGTAGLLLPKVAERYSWTSNELIEHTLRKAMLPLEAVDWEDVEFFKFTSTLYEK